MNRKPTTHLEALTRAATNLERTQNITVLTERESQVYQEYYSGLPATRAKLAGTRTVCARLARLSTMIDSLEAEIGGGPFLFQTKVSYMAHPLLAPLMSLYEKETKLLYRIGLLGVVDSQTLTRSRQGMADLEEATFADEMPKVAAKAPLPVDWAKPN